MSLKITLSAADPLQAAVDLLVLGVAEGSVRRGLARDAVSAIGSSAQKAIKRGDFTGKKGQMCEIAGGGGVKAPRVALVGLGKAETVAGPDIRRAAAKGARCAAGSRATTLAFAFDLGKGHSLAGAERSAAEGIALGAYRYESYKTGERLTKYPLERASVHVAKVSAEGRAAVEQGQRIAACVCIARDLINMPPNDLYPEVLAQKAQEVARERKDRGLSCTVLGPAELKQKGMNLLLAVGQGSVRGPRLVHMIYKPKEKKGETKKLKRLVFIGKGLTFDTGGICIKPAPGMEEMKGDMGGAANVIALMAAVAELQPQAEIHGLIATAENMPDGNAYRPGDIFTAMDGKTVEIINTDAEGRLALADALVYGAKLEPDFMLDNATLTGACVVALGPTVSGYYSPSDELATRVGAAAKRAGEAMWHLPLVDDLREQLKSDWADLKHMGDRWGGSITAALFLREFVGEVPWVHVDIAGPSMANKNYDIYSKGGTGHGVLTFLELIDDLAAPAAP